MQNRQFGEFNNSVGQGVTVGKRSPQWGWVSLLVGSCMAIAAIPATAQTFQLEPVPQVPGFPQADPGAFPPAGVPPTPPGLPPLPSSKRFVVYIPGNNPITLAQVQLIEPEAFVKELDGRRFIQAGVFLNRSNAYRRARELERLVGIRSAIETLEEIPPAIAAAYPPVPSADFSGNVATFGVPGGYFVVVPASPVEFPRITDELIAAGISRQEIGVRSVPFGPHLAIGPFPDLVTAQQERGYIRNFGIDARVHRYE